MTYEDLEKSTNLIESKLSELGPAVLSDLTGFVSFEAILMCIFTASIFILGLVVVFLLYKWMSSKCKEDDDTGPIIFFGLLDVFIMGLCVCGFFTHISRAFYPIGYIVNNFLN